MPTRPYPWTRGRATAFAMATFACALVAACGSRGPLDIDVIEIVYDAGTDASLVAIDAAPAEDAATNGDGATVDAGVKDAAHEASLVDCGLCLTQQCGQTILSCLQDTTCRTTFQCAVQKCIGAGNTDPSCFLQCTSDPIGLLPIISIVTCIASKCGADCTAVLGGLGGGGGTKDGG